jgi:hypothetical protein
MAHHGTESKEDPEVLFTCFPAGHVHMPEWAFSANPRCGLSPSIVTNIKAMQQGMLRSPASWAVR